MGAPIIGERSMAINRPVDLSRINLKEPDEVQSWADQFGVSKERLSEAVAKLCEVDDRGGSRRQEQARVLRDRQAKSGIVFRRGVIDRGMFLRRSSIARSPRRPTAVCRFLRSKGAPLSHRSWCPRHVPSSAGRPKGTLQQTSNCSTRVQALPTTPTGTALKGGAMTRRS